MWWDIERDIERTESTIEFTEGTLATMREHLRALLDLNGEPQVCKHFRNMTPSERRDHCNNLHDKRRDFPRRGAVAWNGRAFAADHSADHGRRDPDEYGKSIQADGWPELADHDGIAYLRQCTPNHVHESYRDPYDDARERD
jgi:hypothetical protein